MVAAERLAHHLRSLRRLPPRPPPHNGGLSRQTLGEDMEVVMRLHHQLRPTRPQTRIAYAADANAWTEIPTSLAPLRGQRIRWHVGLLDNLRIHRRMTGRRRYGAVGLLRPSLRARLRGARAVRADRGVRDHGRADPLVPGLLVVRGRVPPRPRPHRAAADGERAPDRRGRLSPLPQPRPDACSAPGAWSSCSGTGR